MILSKYDIPTLMVSVVDIKNRMWRHFVDVSDDKLYVYFIVRISLYVLSTVLLLRRNKQ